MADRCRHGWLVSLLAKLECHILRAVPASSISAMIITIEFFGLARLRSGIASANLTVASRDEVLPALRSRFPQVAELCCDRDSLRDGWLFNLNGRRFYRAVPDVQNGDNLLLIPADSGG